MEHLGNFAQNYSRAPWRKQLQYAGLFSLALVVVALVAGVYLSVSARAAMVGRDIQFMQKDIEKLDREIEDRQAQLAILMSSDGMENRARNLGFEKVNPEEVIYMSIEGYAGKQPIRLAPYSTRTAPGAPGIPPEYTESIFDWLERQVVLYIVPTSEVQP
jgi:cell division protein FtsL